MSGDFPTIPVIDWSTVINSTPERQALDLMRMIVLRLETTNDLLREIRDGQNARNENTQTEGVATAEADRGQGNPGGAIGSQPSEANAPRVSQGPSKAGNNRNRR